MTFACAGAAAKPGRRILVPRRWLSLAVALGATMLLFAGLVARMLALTGGRFTYALDDAYIHLSLAEQILRGGYGVNPGEPASASSSLLFPYLDAVFLRLGFGQFSALAIELPSLVAAVWLMHALARAGGLIRDDDPPLAAGLLIAFAALVLNLAGLALMGMEHELQVALTLAALFGVVRLAHGARAPWLGAVLVISPLVRFEGAAVLAAGVLALVLAGRQLTAAATLAAGVALTVALAARLHALGLPWVPSSVLVKAAGASAGGLRLWVNLALPAGMLIALLAGLPVLTELVSAETLRGRAPLSPGARIAAFSSPVLVAHLLLGPMGWLHRYEAYAVVLGVFAAVALYGRGVRARAESGGPVFVATALALCALVCAPFLSITLLAPYASRSIWLQQAQMRRLVVDHLRGPVAINDLGQVSWRNDGYVLDLYGLGSEAARRARETTAGPAWMDRLARARGVRLAMIYDSSFAGVPARWTKLGELRASPSRFVLPAVSFYAVDPADIGRLRGVMAPWIATLPSGDYFDATRTTRPQLDEDT